MNLPTMADVAACRKGKLAKPLKRSTVKRKAKREHRDRVAEIRTYVFGRERGMCRCCRKRRAESMHEVLPKSLGGRVSRRNSIALCGDGVRGCHGFLQRHEIAITSNADLNAEDVLYFIPTTSASLDWVKLKQGERIESAPMGSYGA